MSELAGQGLRSLETVYTMEELVGASVRVDVVSKPALMEVLVDWIPRVKEDFGFTGLFMFLVPFALSQGVWEGGGLWCFYSCLVLLIINPSF